MVIEIIDGTMDREHALELLERAALPQGEYLIAAVPSLRSWVEAVAK
jgi:hypothetical protein